MFDDDDQLFHAVVNDDGHYSIWPDGRDLPAGWKAVRGPAPRRECLDHIDEVWTDMRPSADGAGAASGA